MQRRHWHRHSRPHLAQDPEKRRLALGRMRRVHAQLTSSAHRESARTRRFAQMLATHLQMVKESEEAAAQVDRLLARQQELDVRQEKLVTRYHSVFPRVRGVADGACKPAPPKPRALGASAASKREKEEH